MPALVLRTEKPSEEQQDKLLLRMVHWYPHNSFCLESLIFSHLQPLCSISLAQWLSPHLHLVITWETFRNTHAWASSNTKPELVECVLPYRTCGGRGSCRVQECLIYSEKTTDSRSSVSLQVTIRFQLEKFQSWFRICLFLKKLRE